MVEADMLCDRIGIIDHGKITALDTSANLKKVVSGADTTVLELEIPNLTSNIVLLLQSLECVSTVSQSESTRLRILAHGEEAFDSIIDTIRTNNGKIRSVKNLEPTLEDVFLHITGHEVRDSANEKIPSQRHRHMMPRSRVR
jgi:ABC-2 type transport system ATP-binding protein